MYEPRILISVNTRALARRNGLKLRKFKEPGRRQYRIVFGLGLEVFPILEPCVRHYDNGVPKLAMALILAARKG